MKLKLIGLVALMLAPSGPIIINTDSLDLHFDRIGPYTKYQDPCPNFFYETICKTVGGGNYTITIMFGDDQVSNRRVIQNQTGDLEFGQTKMFAVQVPTNICLGDGGMKITFISVNNNTRKTLNDFNFTIYPKVMETVNPLTLSGGKYTSNKTFAMKKGESALTYNEEYDFSSYVDYFLTDTYYALSLEQYAFTRKCASDSFSCRDARLYINGGKQYFPGLTFFNDVTDIPIKLVKNGDKITIDFKITMYVEPKLLIMSLLPKNGYVATKHFFFPVNHNKDLEGLTFTFEIKEMGLSGLTLRWDASYLAVNGLIGSCQNSEYCVNGEPSQ